MSHQIAMQVFNGGCDLNGVWGRIQKASYYKLSNKSLSQAEDAVTRNYKAKLEEILHK